MCLQTNESIRAAFSRAAFLVLDEADRLLDPSFESELRHIFGALPDDKQMLLFSATLTQSLIKLQQATLNDVFTFQVSLFTCFVYY